MVKSEHFCWTLNNWTEDNLTLLRAVGLNPKITYLIWEQEVGDEEQTPHLQGYVQLDGRKDMSVVINIFKIKEIHFIACNGDSDSNELYCHKDECAVERFGEIKYIQARKKVKGSAPRGAAVFEMIRDSIADGMSMREVAMQWPMEYVKYHGGLEKLHAMMSRPKVVPYFGPFLWNVEHDWATSLHLFGASGLGKTCYAKYLLPDALFVSHADQLKNYNSEYSGIIFDDMDFAHWPRTAQIHLLDMDNDRAIHVRYGTALIPAGTKKIFTSNTAHVFLCNDTAIDRRLTSVRLE